MLRKRTKRYVAPILVLLVLACRGAYGVAAHQFLFESAGAAERHVPHAELLADGGAEPHGWPEDAASYAAAILIVVAAIVWTRLPGVFLRRGGRSPRRPWTRHAPPILVPPRPPTTSSLQVYRL